VFVCACCVRTTVRVVKGMETCERCVVEYLRKGDAYVCEYDVSVLLSFLGGRFRFQDIVMEGDVYVCEYKVSFFFSFFL